MKKQHTSKTDRRVSRRIGRRIHLHNVNRANDFLRFACSQGLKYRAGIAWSLLIGKPIQLEKVLM